MEEKEKEEKQMESGSMHLQVANLDIDPSLVKMNEEIKSGSPTLSDVKAEKKVESWKKHKRRGEKLDQAAKARKTANSQFQNSILAVISSQPLARVSIPLDNRGQLDLNVSKI